MLGVFVCLSLLLLGSASEFNLNNEASLLSSSNRVGRELTEIYPDYLYQRYSGADSTSFFGASMGLSAKYAVVGSPGYASFKGKVDIYRMIDKVTWNLLTTINAPSTTETLGSYQYGFGTAVAINARTLVVSSHIYDDYTGRVYVYTQSATIESKWTLTQTIVSPLTRGLGFGYSLSCSGTHLMVGTQLGSDVMMYMLNSGSGLYEAKETFSAASLALSDDERFGFSVSVSDTHAVVGAHMVNENQGAAYVYEYDAGNAKWDLIDSLASEDGAYTFFGFAVNVYNTTVVVGAPGPMPSQYEVPPGVELPDFNGSAYVYGLDSAGTAYELRATIPSLAGIGGKFGYSVSIFDKNLFIGAPGAQDNAGAAYQYISSGTSFEYSLNHTHIDFTANAWGGTGVTVSEFFFAIGAENDNDMVGVIRLGHTSGYALPTAAPTQHPTLAPLAVDVSRYPTPVPTKTPTATPNFAPIPAPTSQPSSQPSAAPSSVPTITQAPVLEAGAGVNQGNSGGKTSIPIIAALVLGFVILGILTTCFIYCCCCGAGAIVDSSSSDDEIIKKKKGDEEEFSEFNIATYRDEKRDLKDADPELLTRLSTIGDFDDDDESTMVGAYSARPAADKAATKKNISAPSPPAPTSKTNLKAAARTAGYNPAPISQAMFAEDDSDSDDDINIKADFAPGAFKSTGTATPFNAKKG